METIFIVIGILVCIMLGIVIILYLTFVYEFYKINKRNEKFLKKKIKDEKNNFINPMFNNNNWVFAIKRYNNFKTNKKFLVS